MRPRVLLFFLLVFGIFSQQCWLIKLADWVLLSVISLPCLLPQPHFLMQEIDQSLPSVSFPLMGPIKVALGQREEVCEECRRLSN